MKSDVERDLQPLHATPLAAVLFPALRHVKFICSHRSKTLFGLAPPPSSALPPDVPPASPVRRLPAPSPSRRSAPRVHRSSTLQQTTAGKVRQFMGAASKQEAKQGIKARVAARTPPLPAARYPHLRRTASARSGPTSTGTTTSTTSTVATPRRAPPALHHHPFPRGSPP